MFGRIETRLEGGNNHVERRVVAGIAIEPSNGPRKTYGRVGGFGVSEVSEDPTDTVCIVCVLSSSALQVPYM